MVLVSLHPDNVFSRTELELLAHCGLDGQWFLTNLIWTLNKGFVDLSLPWIDLEDHLVCFYEEVLPDYLVQWFMEALPEDEIDEGRVRALDEYLSEHEWELLLMAKTALYELVDLLHELQPPSWLPRANLLQHLSGMTVVDSHTSALYFDFTA